MATTVKCELTARVSILGSKPQDRVSIVTLYFGPVKLGSGRLVGKYSPEQVLAEIRRNGAKRFKLEPEAAPVLKSQGIAA